MKDSAGTNADRLAKAEQLICVGSFEDALQVVDELDKKIDPASMDHLTCKLLRGTILNKLGRFEDALAVADRFLLDNDVLGDHIQIVDALIVQASALWRLGRFDESLKVIEYGENLLQKLTSPESLDIARRQGALFSRKGTIFQDKGESDQALEY